uniref:NADH-ubiquinone oxidoreductase chain 3 n=1 Tax=Semnoderes armiger TaxID=1415233 RepID=A0A5H2QCT7_9BILA|nr:NADH dehydrogenase subunit 3 [Semnoderes armiger]AYF57122.1 NADH dehydrogenase subunit 3 [Semnoderes armiger]
MVLMLTMIFFIFWVLLKKNFFFKKFEGSLIFECGFNSFDSGHLPYSLQFFKVAILFLLFDVELIIIMPFLISLSLFFISGVILLLWFILVLMMGLFYEWKMGILDWEV